MSVALDNALSVTALHNHFFFDDRRLFHAYQWRWRLWEARCCRPQSWDKIKEIARQLRNRLQLSAPRLYPQRIPSLANLSKIFLA